jgi:translation initiation factor IF-2
MSNFKLIKVAKDFNVGLSSIVETLHSKGFQIDAKPMADVTAEMFAVLKTVYKADFETKQQADQLSRPSISRPSVSIPPLGPLPPLAPLPPRPAPVVAPIPLSAPPPSPPPPVVVAPVVVSAPVILVEEKQVLVEKAAVITPVIPKVEIPAKKEDVIRASDSARGKVGFNVVGKIDLNAPPPPQPKREFTRPERVVVQENRPQKPAVWDKPAPKPVVVPEVETEPVDPESLIIRAKGDELRGLKILGKVDLNKFKPPAPEPRGGRRDDRRGGQGGQGQGGNRRGGPGGQNQPNQQGQGGQNRPAGGPGSVDSRERRPRKTVTGAPVTGDAIRVSLATAKEATGQKRDSRVIPKEVSQKQIDDQIKQTMARLGVGKTHKRQKIRRDKRDLMREKAEKAELASQSDVKIQVTEFISASELASLLNVGAAQVVAACFSLGVIVSINQRLDAEIIELIANEFGHEIEFISAEAQVEVVEDEVDGPEDLVYRQPIVVVMGHVDHGKTSLLDYIRKANVADGEAGGITQHIGAYEVTVADGKKVTFLDTPGHEAFTAMRARGAKVTDVAIIVIAADDSIMPQTKEAISHAQAAGVKMIFAINKIDKAGADPERIKNELAQMNLLVEDWGGTYQSQDISAKKGENIDKLLEKVALEAEVLDLKANPLRRAFGTILEASLEKGRGYVAKVLIQNGTLREGDPILAGEYHGKVKALFNEHGKRVKMVGPAQPTLVLGLIGAPQAGENLKVTHNEAEAKEIASKRSQIIREQQNRSSKRISLLEIGRRLALGSFKELKLIVKGDVDGSVEALSDSLIKLSVESIQVSVIHKAVGQIVESDVLLASASDAIIIGFNVRPSVNARKMAEKEGVEIKNYSIIYEAIDEIKAAMEGMLEPTKVENIIGNVEIREVFKITKIGTVAGCFVTEGKITRNSHIRIIRDGIVIFPVREGSHGKLGSLKRFKEDQKEVKNNYECGLTIDNFNDIRVGDIVEAYEVNEVRQTLG